MIMVPIPFGFILAYEIVLLNNINVGIYNICFYTSLMSNLLTCPMTYIWLDLFEDSCKEIDKLFKSIQWDCIGNNGRYNANIDVASIDTDVASIDTDVASIDTDVASIDTDGTCQSNINKNIIQVIHDTTKEFENLTEAWSPMLFLSLIMESIIVTNAGFLISKYTILQTEEKNTDPTLLNKLLLILSLIVCYLYVTYVVCTRAEDAHNNVKEVFSKIK